MRDDLSAAYVRSILRYDASTGLWFWRFARGPCGAGYRAGSVNGEGYREIIIDGIHYLEHRLAWLYVKGRWPKSRLDHKDTNRQNNRFANLRKATCTQNQGNSRTRSNNACGLKGIYWHPQRRKWQAQIKIKKKKVFIGRYRTKRQAKAAYDRRAQIVFGEFARAA